eukprot:TRINITY_DN21909_c0_g1_i2.p1 TRINITY_DN21909_c0_g1~~TRINITY_DN21909_c0_g1_i2.p1  ORF type:complete len:161 (-),score=41.22 TRINITY_DN21909_c0_g1_i2:137-571(-)
MYIIIFQFLFFFFFKQKTAYEMQRGLVGSEMCIRDRVSTQSTWGIQKMEKGMEPKRIIRRNRLKRSKLEMNQYYMDIDPYKVFNSTLTGFLLSLIQKNKRITLDEIKEKVEQHRDTLRMSSGKPYQSSVQKSLRSALYLSLIHI